MKYLHFISFFFFFCKRAKKKEKLVEKEIDGQVGAVAVTGFHCYERDVGRGKLEQSLLPLPTSRTTLARLGVFSFPYPQAERRQLVLSFIERLWPS